MAKEIQSYHTLKRNILNFLKQISFVKGINSLIFVHVDIEIN